MCIAGPVLASGSATIVSESCSPANGVVDPGETVTVSLPVQNIVAPNTSNLKGTLQRTGGAVGVGAPQTYGVVTAGGAAVSQNFTFVADPNLNCGSAVTLSLALTDGTTNLGTVIYTIAASSSAGSTTTVTYGGSAVAIPDANGNGVDAALPVSGITSNINDLNFRINGTSATTGSSGLDHTWVGDVVLTLTSPQGTPVTLINLIDSGGVNGNCSVDNFFNTILDDEAGGGVIVDNNCLAGMTGTFRPAAPLSLFDGENPNGTWTVNVADVATGDTGTLRAFALVLTSYSCCSSSRRWTGVTSTDWNTASNWSPSGVPTASETAIIPSTGVTNEPNISAANVSISGIIVASNRTLTVTSPRTLTVTNSSVINGTVNVTGGVTLNTFADVKDSTFNYNGAGSQTAATLSYNNLTVNNAAGVILGGNTTVDGVLTLTSGVVTTGANTMTISCTGSSTGANSTSYVIGNVVKQYCATGAFSFPVGTANGFSKLDTNITALGTNPSSLLVRTDTGTAPAVPPLSSATSLQRYWTLTETGNITANLVFNYIDPTDIMGTEATYQLIRIEGGVAIRIPPPTATVNTVANTASINGVQNFSIWTLGQPAAPTSAPANIGGRVTTVKGASLSNVTMTLLDTVLVESRTTVTDANGNYQFQAITTGRDILVTPSRSGYSFSPTNRLFNHIGELSNVDFVATPDSAQPRATVNDFDGDGKTDLSVLRPSEMTWYINQSSSGQMRAHVWGLITDTLIPADYDGDRKTDIATYRPSTGTWYIFQSATDTVRAVHWGLDTDVATPADFDGDGKADLTVFRASEGRWYVLQSTTNSQSSYQWGTAGDVPVAADYDGDRRADFAIYRPSSGYWYIVNSSDATTRFESWGLATDRVAVGDYDGDLKSDFAVYRPSTGTWHIRLSGDNGIVAKTLGEVQDRPAQGDFDGDGKTDVAVFRPSTARWYILQSSDGLLIDRQWGQAGDIPVVPAYKVAGDAGLKVNPVSLGGCYGFLRSPCDMQTGPFGISTGMMTLFVFTPRGR
jgi:subtilisin-like proprotein convertase family protein